MAQWKFIHFKTYNIQGIFYLSGWIHLSCDFVSHLRSVQSILEVKYVTTESENELPT